MSDLSIAIVTGGAHRLGRVFALTLANQGYAVLIHYHQAAEQAEQTVEEIESIGTPAFSFQANLTKPGQIEALFAKVDLLLEQHKSRLSGLSVLVNSAGLMLPGDARNIPVGEWDMTLNLNLRAPFISAQKAYKRMKRSGLIVNVSDVGAQKAWSRFPAYTISKAGLESMTKVLARSFAPSIRVNTIAPGLVLPSENISDEEWNKLVQRLPLKRPAKTEELSSALEFLLKNEYITGQTIVVDGGYSLL